MGDLLDSELKQNKKKWKKSFQNKISEISLKPCKRTTNNNFLSCNNNNMKKKLASKRKTKIGKITTKVINYLRKKTHYPRMYMWQHVNTFCPCHAYQTIQFIVICLNNRCNNKYYPLKNLI